MFSTNTVPDRLVTKHDYYPNNESHASVGVCNVPLIGLDRNVCAENQAAKIVFFTAAQLQKPHG